MKRIRAGRWVQLVSALAVLTSFVALHTWLADHLPPRPRLQVDGWPMVFSPNGKLLVTMNDDPDVDSEKCEMILWDLETGQRRWSTIIDKYNETLEFSPDSQLLATQYKAQIKVWDTSNGKLRMEKVTTTDRDDGLLSNDFAYIHFSPDGRYLLFQDRTRWYEPIVFWDLAANQEWTRVGGDLSTIHFSPDGKRFALRERVLDDTGMERVNVAFWEMPGGDALPRLVKRMQTIEGMNVFHKPFLLSADLQTCAIVFHRDRAELVCEMQLWDLSKDEDKARLVALPTEFGQLAYPADGHDNNCLEFSPDGRFLMAVLEGGNFNNAKHYTWNANGELQTVHVLHGPPVVSPCGRWLLTPDETGADVWRLGTLQKHTELRQPKDHYPEQDMGRDEWLVPSSMRFPSKYQFSADGRYVMVTGATTTTTPNLLEMVLTGQWSRINTPETDSVGRLWDVERGEEIAAFHGCSNAEFSPDGRTLATTVDQDNHVYLWTIPPRRPYGLILALTTVTWGLFLLACWAIKRRYRRWRRSSSAVRPPPVLAAP